MAGAVRQPIDLSSLSAYLEREVQDIRLPVSIKQVRIQSGRMLCRTCSKQNSLATDSRILPIKLLPATAADMFCGRSLQANYCRRPLIRSSANIKLFMDFRIRMYQFQEPMLCAKIQLLSEPRSTSWSSSTVECSYSRLPTYCLDAVPHDARHVSVACEHVSQLIAYPGVGVLTVPSFEDPSFPGVTARERREMYVALCILAV